MKKRMDTRLIIGVWVCVFNFFAGKGAPADSIAVFFQRQLKEFPQEKLYVHTDRSHYAAADTIWFRIYQADAVTNRPQVLSRYVYVELVNGGDSVIQRIKLRPENEVFQGYFSLPVYMPAGNYTLRAYTNFMRSQDEAYFFCKSVRIGRSDRKVPKEEKQDYDISFFPEGGNFPADVFCKIGFKALDASGWSEEVTGSIVDEEGRVITDIKSEHAGMGSFVMRAEAGKRYFADCKNGAGRSKRFALPAAEPAICSLQARLIRDKLRVSVLKSAGLNGKLSGYSLVLQMRGRVYYADKWDDSKEYIVFEENHFPTGVLQILLLDPALNPVSERLVFCKNDDQGELTFSTDKEEYGIRDRIEATVRLKDKILNPLTGSFSVSVTDDRDIRPDEANSIYSYFLLTSELRGYIESPAFYFAGRQNFPDEKEGREEEEKRLFMLDNLMLTQGWRRYDVSRILTQQYDTPSEELEIGQVISGRVVRPLLRTPVRNAQVGIAAPAVRFARAESTDKDGQFVFTGFEFPDSTHYTLTAFTKNKGDHVEIVLDKPVFPPVSFSWPGVREQSDTASLDLYLNKAQRKASYRDISRVIDLDEIVVAAEKPEPEIEVAPLIKDPIASITYKEIDKFKPSDFGHLLQLLPQFSSVGKNLMIDGFFVDFDLSIVNVHDVARVDLIPEYRSTIFGSFFGKGGVIAVTTKKGGEGLTERTFPNISFTQPLGYQSPARFYSPAYETVEKKNFRVPDLRTTLYWNPDVRLSEEGEATFGFYSADTGTTYSVVMEGLSADGKVICARNTIVVR